MLNRLARRVTAKTATGLALALLSSALASAVVAAEPAANFISGKTLVALCEGPGSGNTSSCNAYFVGVVEGLDAAARAAGGKLAVCPGDASHGDTLDRALKYIKANPKDQELSAAASILVAIKTGYDCAPAGR